MPDLLSTPGCVGLSLLVDHATSWCIATSSWQDQAAMRASADAVRSVRDRFVAEIGGTPPIVDEWEIALMHRDHHAMEGARARASWLQGNSSSIGDSIESVRAILPLLEDLPGFCSASLLVNREAGRAVSTVIYDSADALAQTRARANDLRTYVADQLSLIHI